MNFKKVLSTIAPFLGSLVGGPWGGMAAKIVGETLLGGKEESEEALTHALITAEPDKLVNLKKIDSQYKKDMATLIIEEKKIDALDRENARARQISVKDKIPALLALMLTLGFFFVLVMLMIYPIPTSGKEIINIMIGSLGTAWIASITYYFGSSHTSFMRNKLNKQT